MSLNIKNERVHAMVREAALLTGQSQTGVVETAVERLLHDLRTEAAPDAAATRVESLLADIDGRLDDEARAAMVSDDLYDEHGLPA